METWVIFTNIALVIVTFLLVLVTIGLLFVTYRYVSHTKRMADVMSNDYELRVGPMIIPRVKKEKGYEWTV